MNKTTETARKASPSSVWVYALVWFFFNDAVKLAAYRIFDRQQIGLLADCATR